MRRCASILARPLAIIALAFVACGEALFPCSVDGDCQDGGQGGMCQPEGVCSFPDDDCPSGQRFGAHAGALAGECVSPSVADTSGTPPTTTAPADDDDDDGDPTLDVTGVDTGPSTSSGIGPLDDTATTSDDATSGTTGVELDPTLLLWFPFDDDGVGELTNHGSLGGTAPCHLGQCPTPMPGGPVGAAATFDGVDDCGIFPFVDELAATEFTLALWVRRDEYVQGYDGAFTKPVGASAYNTWRLSLQGSMLVDIVSIHVGLQDNTGVELVSPLVLGTWTHVATTWTGSELELFIDGMSVGAMPSDVFEVDDHDVYVGCDDDVPVGITHFVHGSLDDVRMYARVLDPMEIAALAAM